jgi:hypothetical protein
VGFLEAIPAVLGCGHLNWFCAAIALAQVKSFTHPHPRAQHRRSRMFTFRVFVDDKKLGEALLAVTGIATQVETPQAVVNVVKKNGRLQATGNGSMTEAFLAHLNKTKKVGGQVTAKEMKAFVKEYGGANSSYSNIKRNLCEAKVLKQVATGVYKIMNKA